MPKGLLIVTQAMDEFDPVLGFFVEWVRRLAQADRLIIVACWRNGTLSNMPSNVRVIALPAGTLSRTMSLIRLSWRERKSIQSVFVHMIPPVIVALGWWWRLLGWKIVLWYTHGSVTTALRIANVFCHDILTASDESCRLQSSKKHVIGHGIDLQRFTPSKCSRESFLLTVGRITPRKNLEALIDLCAAVHKRDPKLAFRAVIVGEPRTQDDQAYRKRLHERAREQGIDHLLEWRGAVIGDPLIELYQRAALFVSPSLTGSLDKVVLEAMACATPVLAIGEEYQGLDGVQVMSDWGSEGVLNFVSGRLRFPETELSGRAKVEKIANLDQCILRLAERLFF